MSELLPLYEKTQEKMHVVAFASGSGTNFREAVIASRTPESKFSIDLLITDKERSDGKRIGALDYADEFHIPYRVFDGYRGCGNWKKARESIEGVSEYKRRSAEFNHLLHFHVQAFEREQGFVFDLAVLAGYMRLFQGDLLRRFQNKAVNIHPADLGILTCEGKRKYIGENAVYDALVAGETKTRSSVITVDAETDAGAILVSGPWLEYTGEQSITQKSANEHQKKQKEWSDWPALRFALHGIAQEKFALHTRKFHEDGNPVVIYDGLELEYEGYVMESKG